MNKTRLYLAYGSNLNKRQMLYRCPTAVPFGVAALKDYQLLFRGSSSGNYLTVEPHEGSSVPVGVWEVTAQDERALDRYEGFPSFYEKVETTIPVLNLKTDKTSRRRAFFYVMTPGRHLGLPSKSYLETCAAGYSDFGFTKRHLLDALRQCPEWGDDDKTFRKCTNWVYNVSKSYKGGLFV